MLFAKYGRPEAKFGHNTGLRFLIVRGPTLKKDYTKTGKDRDLIFVPFFHYCNVLNRKK